MDAEKIKELRGLIAQWRATNCRTEAQDRVYRACADQLEPLLAALLDEVEALRRTVASIAADCRRGAHEHGMSAAGVSDIASRCDKALAARHEPKDAEREKSS
jgi:hypothetical protein